MGPQHHGLGSLPWGEIALAQRGPHLRLDAPGVAHPVRQDPALMEKERGLRLDEASDGRGARGEPGDAVPEPDQESGGDVPGEDDRRPGGAEGDGDDEKAFIGERVRLPETRSSTTAAYTAAPTKRARVQPNQLSKNTDPPP